MSNTIQRTKAQAIFFLLGAVLVGGALGFTANRAIEHRDPAKDQRSSREKLADRVQVVASVDVHDVEACFQRAPYGCAMPATQIRDVRQAHAS